MEFELDIVSNGMNGEGVARQNGKVFFVDGAIFGERVALEVVKENKNFCICKLLKVIKASNFRVQPQCKHYNVCGGCNLQHILYDKQLEIKTQNLQNLFNKQQLEHVVKKCLPSNLEYGYRNKITLYLKNNSLCFYKRESNNLVEIEKCCLIDEHFNHFINIFNNFLKLNKDFNSFVIKGLSVRKIQDTFLINVICKKKINFNKLQNYLKLNKINYSLYYCINNNNKSNLPTYPCMFVGGIKSVFLNEYNIKYPVYPMSFLQVNSDVKKIVYDKIVQVVSGLNNVLDAYSGAGLLSAILAKNNCNIYAVEIDQSATMACKELCKQNSIKNVKTYCEDCKKFIPVLLDDITFDCVVLDPARAGVDKNILNSIVEHKVKKVVYLSCNPATLTRDLSVLVKGEYSIVEVQPYDMFPQTSNVETLVVLEMR